MDFQGKVRWKIWRWQKSSKKKSRYSSQYPQSKWLTGSRFNSSLFVANPSNQALSFCRKPSASSALCPSICPFEYSVSQVPGQSALDADGSRQEDNSGIAIISTNPMVAPVIALILNEFNVHTVGQKTQARRQWVVCIRSELMECHIRLFYQW